MSNNEVRTRFAPSPTGYLHVGNVRSALFPWLIARQNNGTFVLRIEDTDQTRFVDDAEKVIFETLEWLGITWDEGPIVGGKYAPYTQTERKNIYLKWAQKLIDKDLAYADPYSQTEVETFRKEAKKTNQPFLYRNYRPSNPPIWDGTQALRFKVPEIKRYQWHDEVMGDLSAGPEALDDIILIKSDGLPTYNFAHIVDDAEMQITHVIRGLEYIPSVPKYLALYDALELKRPILACLPHILTADGHKKLGKRDGAKSILDYKKDGILPEAMLNFIASLGWNDGTEQEIFTRDELIERFDLSHVQRSGARFDEKRLLWMNGQWIRALSVDELFDRAQGFWPDSAINTNDKYKKQVLELLQDRLKTLSDLTTFSTYFFEEPIIDESMIKNDKNLKKITNQEMKTLLTASIQVLKMCDFNADEIQSQLNKLLVGTQQKPTILFGLLRLALSWSLFSPDLAKTMALLGRKKVVSRLQSTLDYSF